MESKLTLDGVRPADYLPGEPRRDPQPLPRYLLSLLIRLVWLGVLAGLSVLAWPLYGLGTLRWGAAPNVPTVAQARRYFRYVWTVHPVDTPLPFHHRLWLTLDVALYVLRTPVRGLAWYLDELLYGRKLDAIPVAEPLIKISAGRSGSTQMARYLEEDPRLVSPAIAQLFVPYLWAWRLITATIGRFVSAEAAERKFHASMPPEFSERHEGALFRTDTFEAVFYLNHLNGLSFFLGPEVFHDEFNLAEPAPWNRRLWDEHFVALFDRMARKTLLWHGPDEDGDYRRIFIKGHFLAAAEALERRYPDARFLTMVRHPSPRLRSAINFLRTNPVGPVLGAPPWTTVAPALVRSEARYCEVEQEFFERDGVAKRCVVRFSDYVQDLEGVMRVIYRDCFDDDELPPHVPREHAPRRRTGYSVDRTLEQVGVDQQALEARLVDYIEWCG